MDLDRRSFILIAAAASAMAPAPVQGTLITLFGYNDMKEMLTALNAEFAKRHPMLRLVMDLPGTKLAPEALAAGRSTLAPMGARFTPDQHAKFVAATGTEPMGFRVAHASLSPKALSGPNGIFVHRDNPLRAIGLDRIAGLFTTMGPHYWRAIGVSGPLREQPILVTGLSPRTALAFEFRDAAFPAKEFRGDYSGLGQSRDVIALIGREPTALGFAALNRATNQVHSLALGRTGLSPPVVATETTLRQGLYPLDRHLWLYARRQKDGALSDLARAYLGFVLSAEGQEIIGSGSLGYLALGEDERRQELTKLWI